jgi:hypothetical protein
MKGIHTCLTIDCNYKALERIVNCFFFSLSLLIIRHSSFIIHYSYPSKPRSFHDPETNVYPKFHRVYPTNFHPIKKNHADCVFQPSCFFVVKLYPTKFHPVEDPGRPRLSVKLLFVARMYPTKFHPVEDPSRPRLSAMNGLFEIKGVVEVESEVEVVHHSIPQEDPTKSHPRSFLFWISVHHSIISKTQPKSHPESGYRLVLCPLPNV